MSFPGEFPEWVSRTYGAQRFRSRVRIPPRNVRVDDLDRLSGIWRCSAVGAGTILRCRPLTQKPVLFQKLDWPHPPIGIENRGLRDVVY